MPRTRKLVPSYLPHDKAQTRARAVWRDAAGVCRFRLLPGAFNTPESLSAFPRLQAELAASPGGILAPAVASSGRTLSEVLLVFLKHAEGHYRSAEDGKPTSELREYKLIIRSLRELYVRHVRQLQATDQVSAVALVAAVHVARSGAVGAR